MTGDGFLITRLAVTHVENFEVRRKIHFREKMGLHWKRKSRIKRPEKEDGMTWSAEGNFSNGESTLERPRRERRTSMGTKTLSAIAAAALTATFAAQATAQNIGNSGNVDTAASIFAQELFGPNSDSIKLTMQADVRLSYPTATTTVGIGPDNYAIFTFRIQGARLAEPVSPGDFTFRLGSDNSIASGFAFTAGEEGGGGLKGDDFVSYRVTSTASAGSTTVLSTSSISNYFRFDIPDLEAVTVANEMDADDRQITVTATVTPPAASRFGTAANNFPRFPADSTVDNDVVAAKIEPAYSLSVVPGSTSMDDHIGNINLDDTSLLTATSTSPLIDVTGIGDTTRRGVKISTVTVTEESGTQSLADGSGEFTFGTTDRLAVVAAGNFAASDRLFLSTTTSGRVTYDEDSSVTLTISSDGTSAEATQPLGGTGSISVGTDYALYYVPGGDEIRRGPIGSRYVINIAAPTGRDSTVPAKDLTLEYSGINFTNYAYGIPGPGSIDTTNLRIRCEGASDCAVFFRCRDQRGVDVGGFERQDITAGAVRHFSAAGLATALGVDTWNGRLSCSLHSSSRVAVQLLVRSGDTLTNNTFIGGLDPSQ